MASPRRWDSLRKLSVLSSLPRTVSTLPSVLLEGSTAQVADRWLGSGWKLDMRAGPPTRPPPGTLQGGEQLGLVPVLLALVLKWGSELPAHTGASRQ